jgi:hypothetical protein
MTCTCTVDVGRHTLTVFAHAPDKGWWYRQVGVSVTVQPAAESARAIAHISNPRYGEVVYTGDDTYTLTGYAPDKSATINQASQSSGIDRVQVYINDGYMGDADLAFSDAQAATFGSQFANAATTRSSWVYGRARSWSSAASIG